MSRGPWAVGRGTVDMVWRSRSCTPRNQRTIVGLAASMLAIQPAGLAYTENRSLCALIARLLSPRFAMIDLLLTRSNDDKRHFYVRQRAR